MSHPSPQRKIFPYWMTLLVGVVLSCIVMNAITMISPAGRASTWENLGAPQVGIKTIIDANPSQIWIEAQDGRFSVAEVIVSCKDADCKERDETWEWKSINDLSQIPKQNFPLIRGNDCENLQDGALPYNPKGQIAECVYAHELGAEYGAEGYFALMADGNILRWYRGSNAIATQLNFIFSTFIFPLLVAIIISVVYLVRYVFRRDFRESAAPKEAG